MLLTGGPASGANRGGWSAGDSTSRTARSGAATSSRRVSTSSPMRWRPVARSAPPGAGGDRGPVHRRGRRPRRPTGRRWCGSTRSWPDPARADGRAQPGRRRRHGRRARGRAPRCSTVCARARRAPPLARRPWPPARAGWLTGRGRRRAAHRREAHVQRGRTRPSHRAWPTMSKPEDRLRRPRETPESVRGGRHEVRRADPLPPPALGPPDERFLAAHQQLPAEERERLNAEFESVMSVLAGVQARRRGPALGVHPEARELLPWEQGKALATDGPLRRGPRST